MYIFTLQEYAFMSWTQDINELKHCSFNNEICLSVLIIMKHKQNLCHCVSSLCGILELKK